MTLREPSHLDTLKFLAELEAEGLDPEPLGSTKALAPPVFTGSGSAGGLFGTSLLSSWQPGAKVDYAAQAGDLRRNSLIAAGLSWLGKNFAEPVPIVERRTQDGWEEVVDHPLTRLIRRPNRHQSWQTLAKAGVVDYKAFGDGFFLIAKSLVFTPGDPIELWWMPRQQVRPVLDPSGERFLLGWKYTVGSRVIDLDLDQVLHFQDGIDPNNNRMGLAALQSCLREVCTDNEAATFTAALLRNCGVSGAMISPANPDHSFSDPVLQKQLAADIKKKTTGENTGEPIVLAVAMKAERLGMSPEELVLDKIRNVPESRLCAAIGVSAMVLGLAVGDKQKTYSNYGEARKAAYEDTLLPDLGEWAYVINRDLLPLLGDPETERFRWDTSGIVALNESEDSKFARANTAFEKGIATKNEARGLVGLPAVANGDVYSDGSTPEPTPAAATEGAAPAGPVAGGEAVVQDTALNGAQITALAGLATQVATGQLPAASARGIVLASFPSLSPVEVDAIVGPLTDFKPPPPEPKVGPPAAAVDGPAEDPADVEVKALIPLIRRHLESQGITP